MFGQTIKSGGGDGRGRKKGYEMPNHKWIARIPTPGGAYRYIYDRAELAAIKGGEAVNRARTTIGGVSNERAQRRGALRNKWGALKSDARSFTKNPLQSLKDIREGKTAYQNASVDEKYRRANAKYGSHYLFGNKGAAARKKGESNSAYLKRRLKSMADRNVNGKIDSDDVKRHLHDFGQRLAKGRRGLDYNHDGTVNFTDLKLIGKKKLNTARVVGPEYIKKGISALKSAPGRLRNLRRDLHNKRFEGNRYSTPEEKAAYDRRKKDFEKMRFNQRLQGAADSAAKKRYSKLMDQRHRMTNAANAAAEKRKQKNQQYRRESGYNQDRANSSGGVNSFKLWKNIANVKAENSRKKYAGQGDSAHYGLQKSSSQYKYNKMKDRYSGSKAANRPRDWREDTVASKNKTSLGSIKNLSNADLRAYYQMKRGGDGAAREIARRNRDRRRSNRRR